MAKESEKGREREGGGGVRERGREGGRGEGVRQKGLREKNTEL